MKVSMAYVRMDTEYEHCKKSEKGFDQWRKAKNSVTARPPRHVDEKGKVTNLPISDKALLSAPKECEKCRTSDWLLSAIRIPTHHNETQEAPKGVGTSRESEQGQHPLTPETRFHHDDEEIEKLLG